MASWTSSAGKKEHQPRSLAIEWWRVPCWKATDVVSPVKKTQQNWGLSEHGYTPKRSKTGTLIGKMIISPWILDFNFGNAQFFGSFRWKPAVSESSLHQGTWDARSPPGTPRRDGTMASRRRSRWRVWERRCPVDWKGMDDNMEIYPLVNVYVDVENPPLRWETMGFQNLCLLPGVIYFLFTLLFGWLCIKFRTCITNILETSYLENVLRVDVLWLLSDVTTYCKIHSGIKGMPPREDQTQMQLKKDPISHCRLDVLLIAMI